MSDKPPYLIPRVNEDAQSFHSVCMVDPFMVQNYDTDTRAMICTQIFEESMMRRDKDRPNEIQLYLSGETGLEFSARDVREALGQAGPEGTLKIFLFSPGGDLMQGLEIYNLLKTTPTRTEVMITGLAASAASFFAMGADRVTATEESLFMIHQAWGVAVGNADEMRNAADMAEIAQQPMVNAYAKKTGKPADDIKALMQAETWYTATEAAAEGFIDEVKSDADSAIRIAASADRSRAAESLQSKYSLLGLPDDVAKQLQANSSKNQKPKTMNPELLKALGLAESAGQEQAVSAIQALQAKANKVGQLEQDLQAKATEVTDLTATVSDLESTITDLKGKTKEHEIAMIKDRIKATAGVKLAAKADEKLTRRAERILNASDETEAADLEEDAVLFAETNGVETGRDPDLEEDPEVEEEDSDEEPGADADYSAKMAYHIKALRKKDEYADAAFDVVKAEAQKRIAAKAK